MRSTTYAPDVVLRFQAEDSDQSLVVMNNSENLPSVLEGECRTMTVRLKNQGAEPIDEIWVLHDPNHVVLHQNEENSEGKLPCLSVWLVLMKFALSAETYPILTRLRNDIRTPAPQKIPLSEMIPTPHLPPNQEITIPLTFHAGEPGTKPLRLLFVYRKVTIAIWRQLLSKLSTGWLQLPIYKNCLQLDCLTVSQAICAVLSRHFRRCTLRTQYRGLSSESL